jgi:hypothetical protein
MACNNFIFFLKQGGIKAPEVKNKIGIKTHVLICQFDIPFLAHELPCLVGYPE